MKGHGGFPSLDYPSGLQYFTVAVQGAGAAAPVAPPGVSAVQPDFLKKWNGLSRLAAEIPTRSGAGAYVITYDADFFVARVITAEAEVFGATGMWAQVSAINAAARTLTVKVFNAGGAATDLANGTDLLVIDIKAQDSTA